MNSNQQPVLVASREFAPINKILIAFDGGPSVKKAVQHISKVQGLKGLECLLLHVGPESWACNEQLEDAATMLGGAGLDITMKSITGQPDSVIASTIDLEGYNLLVMGAYGHSRIRSLIIGSTTTQMLASCKVPVLLFR